MAWFRYPCFNTPARGRHAKGLRQAQALNPGTT